MAGFVLELANNCREKRGCNSVCLKRYPTSPSPGRVVPVTQCAVERWCRGDWSCGHPACHGQCDGRKGLYWNGPVTDVRDRMAPLWGCLSEGVGVKLSVPLNNSNKPRDWLEGGRERKTGRRGQRKHEVHSEA